jgi:hypothetical protein
MQLEDVSHCAVCSLREAENSDKSGEISRGLSMAALRHFICFSGGGYLVPRVIDCEEANKKKATHALSSARLRRESQWCEHPS